MGMRPSHLPQPSAAEDIRGRIEKRTCCRFISSAQDNHCQCGRTRQKHSTELGSNLRPPPAHAGQGPHEPTEWDCQRDTVTQRCDDYGVICFRGFGCNPCYAEFTRVDHITDMDTLWTLLTHPSLWNLPNPGLLLSLTGGAPAPRVAPHLQAMLTRVFSLASVTTGAWVVTDGLNGWMNGLLAKGIAKEAHRICKQDQDPVILGIAPWGSVANSQALEGAGLFPVPVNYIQVEANRSQRNEPSRIPLNHNHTHFLLVDDGTEGRGRSETTRHLRTRLEQHVRNSSAAGQGATDAGRRGCVMVVVGGGVETVEEVWHALTRDTAVLLSTPTGGAADLLQHALGLANTSGSIEGDVENQLTEKVQACLGTAPEETAKVVGYLQRCSEKRRLISVFNLLTMEPGKKGEEAFLLALLKPAIDNCADMESQLSVALACSSLPLARHCIQAGHLSCQQGTEYLHSAMLSALLQGQEDFVALLLNSGLDLSKFLTRDVLASLFDLKEVKLRGEIAELLEYLMKVVHNSKHPVDKTIDKLMTSLFGDKKILFYSHYFKFSAPSHKAAARLLFLWAIVLHRPQLAHVLWKEGLNQTAMALCASRILERLSLQAEKYRREGLATVLKQHSQRWEQRASEVMSQCLAMNQKKTSDLLRTQLNCGARSISLLQMAVKFSRKEFATHTACQTQVANLWRGGLHPTIATWKIVVCVLFPVMVPFFLNLKFRCSRSDLARTFRAFFLAPMVLFGYDLIWHTVFLLGLTRTVLFNDHGPDMWNIILTWLSVFYLSLSLLWRHPVSWISHLIAGLDRLMHVCVVLYLIVSYLTTADTGILVIATLFGYLHIFSTFYIFKTLGPKVVIIRKMAKDFCQLLPFAVLLIVGFGVAYHSLMYPNTPYRSLWHVLQSFLVPYFQMFGEIEIEYFQGLFIDKDNLVDIDGREKDQAVWERTQDPQTRYPDNNPMLPWLLFAYLILMNIMFLNIVVAQLNYRFQQIESNSVVISRFYLMRFAMPFQMNISHRYRELYQLINVPDLDQFEEAATQKYLLHHNGKQAEHGEWTVTSDGGGRWGWGRGKTINN